MYETHKTADFMYEPTRPTVQASRRRKNLGLEILSWELFIGIWFKKSHPNVKTIITAQKHSFWKITFFYFYRTKKKTWTV